MKLVACDTKFNNEWHLATYFLKLSSRYVFSYVMYMGFRIIHFILISTAHALFLTCLRFLFMERKQDYNATYL